MTPDQTSPQGEVLAVDGDEAIVVVDAGAVCARCAAGKGCGAGIFAAGRSRRRLTARISPGLEIHVGDRVRLELPPADVLFASALAYGLPLIGLVSGAGFAAVLLPGRADVAAALLGAAGLAVGAALGRRLLRRQQCPGRFRPTIVGPAAGRASD